MTLTIFKLIFQPFTKSEPNFEESLRARARAGHLNIHRTFDIESHALILSRKGDIRQHFAKLAAGQPVTNRNLNFTGR